MAYNLEPELGYYDQRDPHVIEKHFEYFDEAGFDFIMFSWWGPNSYTYVVTRLYFEKAKALGIKMRFFIMVESIDDVSYLKSDAGVDKAASYIYDNYVKSYSDLYME